MPTPQKLRAYREKLADMTKVQEAKSKAKATARTKEKVAKEKKPTATTTRSKNPKAAKDAATVAAPVKKRGRPPKKSKQEDATIEVSDGDGSDGAGCSEPEQDDGVAGLHPVQWSKIHTLTDSLLTHIEDNEVRRTALGFTKGDKENAGKQSGDKLNVHFKALAELVLIAHDSGFWKDVDAKHLIQPIRYRVHMLKKDFNMYRQQLKDTGNGLVMAGKEDELTGELKNLWDKILKRFPWYKRLYVLLAGSPIYDEHACTNSGDNLDGGINELLDRHSHSRTNGDPAMVSDKDDGVDTDSHRGSPGLDDDTDQDVKPAVAVTKPDPSVKADIKPVKATKEGPTSVAGKRKHAMVSELQKMVATDRDQRERLVKQKLEARTARHKQEQQTAIQTKKMELEWRAKEADKQRQHQLEMMRLQLSFSQHPQHSQQPTPTFGSTPDLFFDGSSLINGPTGMAESSSPFVTAGHSDFDLNIYADNNLENIPGLGDIQGLSLGRSNEI